MKERIVSDIGGRTWTCTAADDTTSNVATGQDVMLTCSTPSVPAPVNVTVSWQWERMAPNGLARAINVVSPAPRS
jgi:hypothetical protein